ncbi:LacI family DNA-binding transcriptional regulator [Pararobbsia alpina]|uniref:LacI family DNA-binding transcriptional regulator n=1 Tax=Pararobbsia alpina TaxID=621374 RepID=UPI003CCE267C
MPGVTPATVSNAMRDRGKVGATMRKRVLAAVAENSATGRSWPCAVPPIFATFFLATHKR